MRRTRSTQFLLECNPAAGRGAPAGVFGDCTYLVTWETAHACPLRPAPALSLLFWAAVALLAYLAAGFLRNVRAAGGLAAAGGWDALPHAGALRAAGRRLQALAGDWPPRAADAGRRLAAAAWGRLGGGRAGSGGYRAL